jgi:hypothetical protein
MVFRIFLLRCSLRRTHNKLAHSELAQIILKKMIICSGLRKIFKWKIHQRKPVMRQLCHLLAGQLLQDLNPTNSALLSRPLQKHQ